MTSGWTTRAVATSLGPARVLRRSPRGSAAAPVVVLGHGAGGGLEAVDLQATAERLAGDGVRVVLVEQPWRTAGRRLAPAPTTLDRAWLEVLGALRLRGPVVVGGRSAGARVACRTARSVGAVGVLCLAFPLHPPGRPDRSRADELAATGVPTIVVQGSRDPFGSAAEVAAAVPAVRVVEVPGGDHGLGRVDLAAPLDVVRAWLGTLRGQE